MQTSCLACGVLIPTGGKGRCAACRTKRDEQYNFVRAREPHRSTAAYKTPGWQKARRIALNRANHTCTACGTNQNLQVHHRLSLNEGGTHDQDNLVVVCRSCHPRIEAQDKAARRLTK